MQSELACKYNKTNKLSQPSRIRANMALSRGPKNPEKGGPRKNRRHHDHGFALQAKGYGKKPILQSCHITHMLFDQNSPVHTETEYPGRDKQTKTNDKQTLQPID